MSGKKKKWEKMGENRWKRVDKRQILVGILGITLGLLVFLTENREALSPGILGIPRAGYGMEAEKQTILVEGLSEKPQKLALEISPREFSEEAAEEAFSRAAEELSEIFLGENPSPEEVREPLCFPDTADEGRVLIRWHPGDGALVGADGRIYAEDAPEEGIALEIAAELMAGEYSETIYFPVIIRPPVRSGEEARLFRLIRYLGKLDEESRTGEMLPLPEEFEALPVHFRRGISWNFLFFITAGIGTAVLLPFMEQQRREERQKKEEREFSSEYPELLAELAVYLGAGLPVRGAFERMAEDYENSLARGSPPRRAAEELAAACHRMRRGMPEREAYLDFGRRCRALSYRRLSGILTQNLRNGSESLSRLLEEEMTAAFAERRTAARRAAEETQTKLCFPLVMMLAAVMMMVTVPAFLSL